MDEVPELVERLFRQRSGELTAVLTRTLGARHFELAEEAVQEALGKALQTWPFHGMPENPGAWLFRAARNFALDQLRREQWMVENRSDVLQRLNACDPFQPMPATGDDTLAMIYLCCHSSIALESRVALTLKAVGGLSIAEIARAFLTSPETIAQRVIRAKKKIRSGEASFGILPESTHTVMDVLYLMFNEGYSSTSGDEKLRIDLCDEAIRLARLLPPCPEVHALLALFLFQTARLYDATRIAEAMWQLNQSIAGDKLTVLHLEAGIAAAHSSNPVDWLHVVSLYDQLYALKPTPVVGLNRGVAIARAESPAAGIRAIELLEDEPALHGYYLLPATLATLWSENGDQARAQAYFKKALACVMNAEERLRFEQKLKTRSAAQVVAGVDQTPT